jgi:hypothetical protein
VITSGFLSTIDIAGFAPAGALRRREHEDGQHH